MFLGTSGSMPTPRRAPTALLVRRGGERLLFDCAEGTQRQLLKSSVGLIELREIFITHYHAGSLPRPPGMLKTFALRGRELPMTVYGPPGLRDLFGSLRRIFGRLTYECELIELRRGTSWHGTATSSGVRGRPRRVGGRLRVRRRRSAGKVRRRRGRRARCAARAGAGRAAGRRGGAPARWTRRRAGGGARASATRQEARARGDTAPFHGVVEAAAAADLLVHEATFLEDELERARETSHSTAADAAGVAREAGVELLGAHAPVEPLLRPRRCRGGQGGLPGHGRAEGLRYHRASLQGARNAAAREGWSAAPP